MTDALDPAAPDADAPEAETETPGPAGGDGTDRGPRPGSPQHDVLRRVEDFLDAAEVEWERGSRTGEVVASLPGEHKLRTVVSLLVGERALSGSAFVIRNPDEAHERFYRTLLRRNLRLAGVAYAIDGSGDVYVTSRVPLAAVDEGYLDDLLGAMLSAADDPFDELLEIGFVTAIRKEWAWRTARGESTRNLEAFRHLLVEQTEEPDDASAPRPGPAGEDAHPGR